jgi:HEAT repeat protein
VGHARLSAIKGLGRLGDPQAAAALTLALQDRWASMRVEAAASLLRLKVLAHREQAALTLLLGLHDRNPDVRAQAVLALGDLERPLPGTERALTAALGDEDRRVRQAAGQALRQRQRGRP